MDSSSFVKSKSLGKSRPLGIRVPSVRSSSNRGCTMAEMAVSREVGVYSSNRETRSIASAGVRGRNTLLKG